MRACANGQMRNAWQPTRTRCVMALFESTLLWRLRPGTRVVSYALPRPVGASRSRALPWHRPAKWKPGRHLPHCVLSAPASPRHRAVAHVGVCRSASSAQLLLWVRRRRHTVGTGTHACVARAVRDKPPCQAVLGDCEEYQAQADGRRREGEDLLVCCVRCERSAANAARSRLPRDDPDSEDGMPRVACPAVATKILNALSQWAHAGPPPRRCRPTTPRRPAVPSAGVLALRVARAAARCVALASGWPAQAG